MERVALPQRPGAATGDDKDDDGDDPAGVPVGVHCFALASILDLSPNTTTNILATKVWPSARVAARVLDDQLDPLLRLLEEEEEEEVVVENDDENENDGATRRGRRRRRPFLVCEVGCGPGLPSLAAAAVAAQRRQQNQPRAVEVVATDVDGFALELVAAAAGEQGLSGVLRTRKLDLLADHDHGGGSGSGSGSGIDLLVLSDVFESGAVAVGAAGLSHRVLSRGGRVWAFAQGDRVQRDAYLGELSRLRLSRRRHNGDDIDDDDNDNDDDDEEDEWSWKPHGSYALRSDRLWLCDVDETAVDYHHG